MSIVEAKCRICGAPTPFDTGDDETVTDLGYALEAFAKEWAICETCAQNLEAKKAEEEQRRCQEREAYETALRIAEKGKRMEAARIPKLYAEPWDGAKGNTALLAFVLDNAGRSIFLGSLKSGVGKTRALCHAAREIILSEGLGVEFWKTTQLTRTLAGLYRESVKEADAEMKRLCELDLLILDDLCKEKLTDRAGELLYDLIDERFSQCRRTWITSNYSGAETAEKFGERGAYLLRRLREDFAFWCPKEEL